MVSIQKQYLARDKEIGDKVTATLKGASRLMQNISSLVDEEKKYLEKKEKREEEKLELKRREVEEVELKKELGVSTGGGNSQKSGGVMVQVAPDQLLNPPSLFMSDTSYESNKQNPKVVGVASSCLPRYRRK